MKITTTVFLACLLCGLGIYYAAWERPSAHPTSELGPARVLTFEEKDAIVRLHILNRGNQEKFSLAKKSSGWKIESPVFAPAEDFLVEGMIRVLTFSPRLRRFVWKSREGEKGFGFDAPRIELGIETKNSTLPRTLVVGKPSPMGVGVFAQWKGEKEYFLIPHEAKAALDKSLHALRQKKIFRANWDKIHGLQVRAAGKYFRLEKTGEKWRFAIPKITQEIPVVKVSELIYAFQSLYVKEFLDGAKPGDPKYGLEKPVAFLAAGEGDEIEKLILGAQVPGKDALYARRENENLVLLVSEKNLTALLEIFQVTFHEIENVNPGKSKISPPENRVGVPAERKKTV